MIAGPAAERIPVLNEVGIRTVINGPIPVSADGEPVMGIAEGIDNFFIACGFTAGIAASGGAGLAMANWIARRSRHGSGRPRPAPLCGRRHNLEPICGARCALMRATTRFRGRNRAGGAGGYLRKLGKLMEQFMQVSSA